MNRQMWRAAPWIVGSIALGVYSVATAQSKVAEAPMSAPNTTQAAGGVLRGDVLPGYVHDLSRSRFKIGKNAVVEVDTPRLRRLHGSLGAWAIDPTNNWSMGILDAAAPTGPYILDEAIHGARVKAYFIAAGLPADQIRDVRATYEVGGGGPVGEATVVQVHSINSILTRSVKGIPVVESVAWAKMTMSGDVDMENVFWPPIERTIVDRAVAFAHQMADPAAHAAYLAKLPGQIYKDGGVVIHHTDPSVHSTPTAYVSYNVTLAPEGHVAMRHFDENGKEFRLPQERVVPPQLPAVPHPKQ